jgi:hypothetical protein
MHLVPVIVFTLAGVFTAVMCVRRAMLGGQMEHFYEVQKSLRPIPRHRVPRLAAIGKAPIQGGAVSLEPSEIGVRVQDDPHLPRVS